MIFVTVGTQGPFDRLVRTVDDWASENKNVRIFAQIGESEYIPSHLEWKKFIIPEEFNECVAQCWLVVSHAGMGIIISSLRYFKPILVLPRKEMLKETRGSHQMDTAKVLSEKRYIYVAWDEHELKEKLDHPEQLKPLKKIGDHASDELLDALDHFISQT